MKNPGKDLWKMSSFLMHTFYKVKMDLAFICDLLDKKILSPPHCFLNTIINVHYHETYNRKLSLSP